MNPPATCVTSVRPIRTRASAASAERQAEAQNTSKQLLELLEQNTRLTEMTKQLTERIDTLTCEMHAQFVRKP